MSYGTFLDEEGNDAGGSFEILYIDEDDCFDLNEQHLEEHEGYWFDEIEDEVERKLAIQDEGPYTPGWYWRACFPGCLPDGEPNGPFKNDETAERAAEQGAYHADDIDWELTRNEEEE